MLTLLLIAMSAAIAEPSFCDERPDPARTSLSLGHAANGQLLGAVRFIDSPAARILPLRHTARCLWFATSRLVRALHTSAERVRASIPNTPPLGVGDLSRARGGPIPPYSRSHQSGRDADIAFYATDSGGSPVAAVDLFPFSDALVSADGALRFDVERNWQLVAALLADPSIDIEWLFVAPAIAQALFAEAERQGAAAGLLDRAKALLHQPSDAPPHNDHLHLRIRCAPEERRRGCVD
jgi:penicillin-insensitive murein endopeptidase